MNTAAQHLRMLGERLDQAELAAADACVVNYDYIDRRGHLQHRSAQCPVCIFHNLRQEYFAAARVPAIIDYEQLQDAKPPTKARLAAALNTFTITRALRKQVREECELASAREIIDAEVTLERAEIKFKVFLNKYRDHLVAIRAQAKSDDANGVNRVQRWRKPQVRQQ